ncbi:MAG TPA: HAMP domain-containing sensor histidine kinase [Acidimicrobiales bacterium]
MKAPWTTRRLPQTVRVRLSVLFAALFLAAGAILLGVTYGLVASSLPRPAPISTKAQLAKLDETCKLSGSSTSGGQPATIAGKPVKTPPPVRPSAADCQKVFAAGASAASTAQRDQTLHNLLLFSLLGLGAVTLASGGLGWFMAGRVLRPVRAITGAARRASEGHLGERLALQGPRDELKELADTFDEMLDRLDAAFETRQRFVADASHELRTPLTVMRTSIDVTLAKASPSTEQLETMAVKVRRSVDQAEALIDALLTMATSERGLISAESIDLATLAEDALDVAGPAISESNLEVDTQLGPAETSGDRLLLERLVGNLVDNAVRHNNSGGWMGVRTGWERDAGAFVEVTNSGPVIDSELVPLLFEPFRRVEERTSVRDGVGLGLAIVKSICVAHGATVEARSQPEGGLTVKVVIPRNDQVD